MCKRIRNRRKRYKKNQTGKKRKRKRSCKARCCRWICRKITRCIKKKVFGSPNVGLDDFEFAGVNLGSVRDKLMRNQSKHSFSGAFKNAKELKKKHSLSKSKEKLLDELVDDYDKGKMSLTQLQKIQLDPKKINKTELIQMLNDYDASKKKKKSIMTLFRSKKRLSKLNVNDIDLIDGLDAVDLQNNYKFSESKAKLLENMVTDYKIGRISLSGLSHKSKFDPKALTKTRLNKMLENYDTAKKKNIIKEVVENPQAMKKKYSIKKPQQKILEDIASDYKKGKISKTQLAKIGTVDPNNLTKEQVHKFLEEYAQAKKEKEAHSIDLPKINLHNWIDMLKRKSFNLTRLIKR